MRIAVLTSSRADFGIYLPLLKKLQADDFFSMELVVFGTHLSKTHGETVNDIIAAGFQADHTIDTVPSGDSPEDIAGAVAKTFSSFGEFWSQQATRFDLVLCLGDRYEMFAAVLAAVPFNTRIAHLHGGETTLGATDNIYRHAISHASQIHFASTEAYAERLRKMLDDPRHVYNAGSLSLDNLDGIEWISHEEFKTRWNINLDDHPVLLTYHPETVRVNDNEKNAKAVAAFIRGISYPVVVTMPNADASGNTIRRIFESELRGLPEVTLVENFGTLGYFTLLKHCLFVAGNSSSAIIEAASFHKYVVNIGDRQLGRMQSGNVINLQADVQEMKDAFLTLKSRGDYDGVNIYRSDVSASDFIIETLKKIQQQSHD